MISSYFSKWAAAVILIVPPFCFAQDSRNLINKAGIPAEAGNLQSFVPRGWKIEAQITGDLNGDTVADYALKLVEDKPAKDTDDTASERQRALVIVLQKSGGRLERAAVADKLLQCTRCGGSFYGVSESPANVAIEKGVLIVDQDHGSRNLTNTTYKFRLDPATQQFNLIGFDYADADRATAQVIAESNNYVTGLRVVTRSKGARDVESRSKIQRTKTSIEKVDSEKFEAAAVKRLGLG